MEKLTRLNATDRDNLTAYLDGELDENSTRRIESILTSSAVARNDVEILARTYELLDLLPRPSAGRDFTEKTVATARQEHYRKPLAQQPWYLWAERGLLLGGWSLVMIAAATGGFALSNHVIPTADDLLLDHLPLIENLDVYEEIDRVEFLQALANQSQLLEEIRGATQP